jgi:type II secretory ATPase GspE/PulE/Tfp pilus assembly ATPase PilB-like protein
VKASAVTLGLNFVHLEGKNISRDALAIIPETVARNFNVIAYEKEGNEIKVAVGRPYNLGDNINKALAEIEKDKGVKVHLDATTMKDITWAFQAYSSSAAPVPTSEPAPNNPTPGPDQSNEQKISNINLVGLVIKEETLAKFPLEIAKKYQMVVFEVISETKLKVAAVNPDSSQTKEIVDFIQKRNNISIILYQTDLASFNYAIAQYGSQPAEEPKPVAIDTKPQDAPTAQDETEPSPAVPVKSGTNEVTNSENNLNNIVQDMPAGTSPQEGGKTPDGVPIIGSKDISAVSAAPLSGPISDDNLEERNLDSFLGKNISNVSELIEIVKSGFIPKTVAAILSLGVNLRASDIHLEPMKNFFRLRYRVDGDLSEYLYMPLTLQPPLVSRIKILSNLKIDEQRIPQDGRYDAIANKHEFDVRVSSLPTVNGEKIVMRLLDKSGSMYTLEQLGVQGKALDNLNTQLKKPWGVILATGPTGSGKSTTLYAILNKIATPNVNAMTHEDPVEYEMKGVNQVQVKPKIGFSFAEGLRSILRQDPNIIMVGEIRDGETAELATHAALTGHLVLSTLHTNDAAGALPRLINMGIEPYLITSAINAIIAQRLVRKLCQKCKTKANIPDAVLNQVKDIMKENTEFDVNTPLEFFQPGGCDECKTGFEGRVGIYEVLVMSDTIEEAAIKKETTDNIAQIAIKEGMVTMQQDGIMKALQGLTTLDEVFKVTSVD